MTHSNSMIWIQPIQVLTYKEPNRSMEPARSCFKAFGPVGPIMGHDNSKLNKNLEKIKNGIEL